MAIENGNKVSLEFTLILDDGSDMVSNIEGETLEFTQGNGDIFPTLEQELIGLDVGDTKSVKLVADQAFGQKQQDALQNVPIDQIPENTRQPGAMLVVDRDDGEQEQVHVHDVTETEIIVDFNHPLAGENLTFEVKVLSIQ